MRVRARLIPQSGRAVGEVESTVQICHRWGWWALTPALVLALEPLVWAQVTAVYAWLVLPGGRYKVTCSRLLLCWSGGHLEEVTLQGWLSILPGWRAVEVIMMGTEAVVTVLGL